MEMDHLGLAVGMKSEYSNNGIVTIVDQDDYSYQVLCENESKHSVGIRTISKILIAEWKNYLQQHINASAKDIHQALVGQSDIDRFEYGNDAVVHKICLMALGITSHSEVDVSGYFIRRPPASKKMYHIAAGEIDSYQIVTYGAPGTGKSFQVKGETKGKPTFRTTFHPDSDYSTFVGAYKPTKDDQGAITYDFVAQTFIRAYVASWKNCVAKLLSGGALTNDDRVYLVIEEINRGHCAQIFGDLFQLLDRNEAGFSDYPIDADVDLAKWLDAQFAHERELAGEDSPLLPVLTGKKLCLPPNLYIRATMNTSDQSLFPMDSAFKRRWDWKYVPLSKPDETGFNERKIVCKVGGERNPEKKFDWWAFLGIINEAILKTTKSEDKQLGYFFVKVPNDPGEISAEKFAGKVLFYLYNDVFKDYNYPDAVFTKKSTPAGSAKVKFAFKDFFDAKGKAKDAVVAEFLLNLGVPLDDQQPSV